MPDHPLSLLPSTFQVDDYRSKGYQVLSKLYKPKLHTEDDRLGNELRLVEDHLPYGTLYQRLHMHSCLLRCSDHVCSDSKILVQELFLALVMAYVSSLKLM